MKTNKTLKTTLVGLFLLTTASLFAQTTTFSAKSGDKELDLTLSELNTSASVDMGAFKLDMTRTYGVTDAKITDLQVSFGMQAGDIFMTLELSKLTKKPILDVATVYKKNKGQGWGVIAKELGIKPGSTEFHALKATAKQKKTNASMNAKSKGNSGKKAEKVKVTGKGK